MRLIDGDALVETMKADEPEVWLMYDAYSLGLHDQYLHDLTVVEAASTVNGWISVKDGLPEEHDSMFAQFYGTNRWNGAMWRTESDRVLVAILFPDGTRTVDKGKLQDGEWRTGVARVLPQKVTHWAVWPEPPKEEGK